MTKIRLALAMLLAASVSSAAMKTEVITYKDGAATLEGFLAYDDAAPAKRPGVIVFHEWWGLNDFVKQRAMDLASQGYVAFAADVYGKGIHPTTPEDAGKQAGIYKGDRKLMRSRAIAGLKQLQKNSRVDAQKLAAIGFCFGGTAALELARSGADLDGVVTFHGGLSTPTPADAKNIKGKVLALHGADDPYVKQDEVAAFVAEMNAGHVNWELVQYSGTVHAFTNPAAGNDPTVGAAYNKESADRAWKAMRAFLDEIFSTTTR